MYLDLVSCLFIHQQKCKKHNLWLPGNLSVATTLWGVTHVSLAVIYLTSPKMSNSCINPHMRFVDLLILTGVILQVALKDTGCHHIQAETEATVKLGHEVHRHRFPPAGC